MTIAASRRDMLKGAGALALAFDLPAASALADEPGDGLPGDLKKFPKIGAWLRVEEGGKIRLLLGKVELGQGVLTAATQLCAEELDVDLQRIVITSGDTRISPNEGVTAGSFSMPECGSAVRQVSAEARQILIELAARALASDPGRLVVSDGVIRAPDGRSLSYWDLVKGDEFAVDATGKAPLKPRAARRFIGKPVPRIDIPSKVTGTPIFIQDLRPDGMLHGRVLRPPAYRARLSSLDTTGVEQRPGVVRVVRSGSFVGVVAEREDIAIDAVSALRAAAKWDVPTSGETQDTVHDWLLRQPAQTIPIKTDPSRSAAEPVAKVEAVYRRPYHMHASIGPSTALATLDADGVTHVQTHSQSVFETAAAIADMLQVDSTKVHCQHVQGSGCYGHNGADDAAADAALLAQAVPARPVRIQWSRNDEHQWEPYGSAMTIKTLATLDASGDVIDWTLDLWSTSHGVRPGGKAGNLLPAQTLEQPVPLPTPVNAGPPNYAADRNAIALYAFPGQTVRTHFIKTFAARASSTRGLGAYANVFAVESFIDELAARAGVDPLAYRLRYLKDERGRAVLQKAADLIGWAAYAKTEGRGVGLAFARYKNLASFTAVAMEVEVDRKAGTIRALRVACANDCGEVVAPDGVRNQIEGGVIQSLSWTLKEEVRFDPSGVKSADWTAYPILTFSEIPPIHVELIDRPGSPFLGAGEAAQGPTGAALANAVFAAAGVRLRDIPFTPARVKAALQS